MECWNLSEFAPFMISLTDFEIGKRIARGSLASYALICAVDGPSRTRRGNCTTIGSLSDAAQRLPQ
jgi:hypothetical protein